MNIKSLLLGSAAAAVAFTGAQAADAIIIAEPEPLEYVRICDAYGAGFFYIPGTETCLAISGFVFHQMGASSGDGAAAGDTPSYMGAAGDARDGWSKHTRARVNFDARSETEWGTLRSYIRIQTDSVNAGHSADGAAGFDQAWLSLGGFLAGYTESAFHSSNLVGSRTNGGGFSYYQGGYGYSQRQLVQYNFSGSNGFFAVLSLENDQDTLPASVLGNPIPGGGGGFARSDSDNFMPDVVAKIGVQQGWYAAWLTVGVDEESVYTGDTEFAVKAGVDLNLASIPGSRFRLIGHYNSDANAYMQSTPGVNATTGAITDLGFGAEWSVYAGYYHQFNPQFAAWIGAQYYNDIYVARVANALAGNPDRQFDGFHIETGFNWTPVRNFEVKVEGHYTKIETLDGTASGFLRFTRYF